MTEITREAAPATEATASQHLSLYIAATWTFATVSAVATTMATTTATATALKSEPAKPTPTVVAKVLIPTPTVMATQ